MPRRERLENNVTSTLSSTINSSVTTVTVASGTNFPSEGDLAYIRNKFDVAENVPVAVFDQTGQWVSTH